MHEAGRLHRRFQAWSGGSRLRCRRTLHVQNRKRPTLAICGRPPNDNESLRPVEVDRSWIALIHVEPQRTNRQRLGVRHQEAADAAPMVARVDEKAFNATRPVRQKANRLIALIAGHEPLDRGALKPPRDVRPQFHYVLLGQETVRRTHRPLPKLKHERMIGWACRPDWGTGHRDAEPPVNFVWLHPNIDTCRHRSGGWRPASPRVRYHRDVFTKATRSISVGPIPSGPDAPRCSGTASSRLTQNVG